MQKKVTIILNTFNKINKFNNKIVRFESDIDLVRGEDIVDAKSSMSIFALNLSTPVDVIIHSESEKEIKIFNEVMEEFK